MSRGQYYRQILGVRYSHPYILLSKGQNTHAVVRKMRPLVPMVINMVLYKVFYGSYQVILV